MNIKDFGHLSYSVRCCYPRLSLNIIPMFRFPEIVSYITRHFPLYRQSRAPTGIYLPRFFSDVRPGSFSVPMSELKLEISDHHSRNPLCQIIPSGQKHACADSPHSPVPSRHYSIHRRLIRALRTRGSISFRFAA